MIDPRRFWKRYRVIDETGREYQPRAANDHAAARNILGKGTLWVHNWQVTDQRTISTFCNRKDTLRVSVEEFHPGYIPIGPVPRHLYTATPRHQSQPRT